MIYKLNNTQLLECYLNAKELSLDQEFISLLYKEIRRRKITFYSYSFLLEERELG